MPAEPNEDNIRDYLIAAGDGELDATDAAAVWAYLAESPGAVGHLQFLRDQQRLTAAARLTFQKTLPPALRSQVERAVHVSPARSPASRRFGWRSALAVAAGIVLGVGVVVGYRRASDDPPVVPARLVADVARVHAECARLPENLHDATFESIDGQLAAGTLKDLGGATATPDLSKMGYHCVGAGPCPAAKFDTVHLLYRNDANRPYRVISLFVQTDHGQYARLTIGKVFRVSSADMPYPVLAWRGRGVLYFLVADTDREEAQALQVVRPTSSENLVTFPER